MPTTTSPTFEADYQLAATADLLTMAAKAIRKALETSDTEALYGVAVALEDRSEALRGMCERS